MNVFSDSDILGLFPVELIFKWQNKEIEANLK